MQRGVFVVGDFSGLASQLLLRCANGETPRQTLSDIRMCLERGPPVGRALGRDHEPRSVVEILDFLKQSHFKDHL